MIPEGAVEIFDDGKGFIKLVEIAGSELSIINAAKVSFGKQVNEVDESGIGLINFLLKNKHGSPFEHNFFAFHIKTPLFVMREWQRHRIGFSYNEMSGRYSELKPDFYIPNEFRTQHGKPGAYYFEEWKGEEDYLTKDARASILCQSQDAYACYQFLLQRGIAKEQARIILPLNLYTEIRWTCNARSLMNFLALRNSNNAMFEIMRYAEELEKIFKEQMPNVCEAFINNNRVSP